MKAWDVYYLTYAEDDIECENPIPQKDTVFYDSSCDAHWVFHGVSGDYPVVLYVISEQANIYPQDFNDDEYEQESYPGSWWEKESKIWKDLDDAYARSFYGNDFFR